MEREQKLKVQSKLEKSQDDNSKLVHALQETKQVSSDKELRINKMTSHFRETLAKIFQFVKLQISKHRTEMDFTKKQFISEIEMNRR